MAKSEDTDTDSRKARNATESKKELQRQVKSILDEDDYEIKAIDEAIRILSSLKELKVRAIEIIDEALRIEYSRKELKLKESVVSSAVVPEEFECPISREIMSDPVLLANGQTFDRQSIQEWLDKGHRTCPKTQQAIYSTVLTPNLLVREMISQWRKEHGIEVPKQPVHGIVHEDVITHADPGSFALLLWKLSSFTSLSDQKKAAKELRSLTKRQPSFRALFRESSYAISKLLEPLLPPVGTGSAANMQLDPDIQEDLITTVRNISIPWENKRVVAENRIAIPRLIESLITGLTIKTRRNAAAALFTLSELDSNKVIIGNLGALKPMIDLLEEGHPLVMREVLSAICKLCECPENIGRAVDAGAVRVILKKITEEEGATFVAELISVLALLCSQSEAAVKEMGEFGAVPALLSILRESNTDETNLENCAAILLDICWCDRSKRTEMMEEENAHGTLSNLARTGSLRAQRKITTILYRMK